MESYFEVFVILWTASTGKQLQPLLGGEGGREEGGGGEGRGREEGRKQGRGRKRGREERKHSFQHTPLLQAHKNGQETNTTRETEVMAQPLRSYCHHLLGHTVVPLKCSLCTHECVCMTQYTCTLSRCMLKCVLLDLLSVAIVMLT